MNKNSIPDAAGLLKNNPYPGRAIIVGTSENGEYALAFYILTGRSAHSRNRRLKSTAGRVYTVPVDEKKVVDPRLIIYPAMARYGNSLIVTNGDQTLTLLDALKKGRSFAEALNERAYEPDAPHYTPRISALLRFDGDPTVSTAILRRDPSSGDCERVFRSYACAPGRGRYFSTYARPGEPLPSFGGDPVEVRLEGAPPELCASLWEALDGDNRIALCMKKIALRSKRIETVIVNKYE
ncbi:MAG: inosine monophosphate cyclohydrolase [Clostridia bacterium]|nr:inosine monophosphate cyclohydrolase [Clostridia bacterium]